MEPLMENVQSTSLTEHKFSLPYNDFCNFSHNFNTSEFMCNRSNLQNINDRFMNLPSSEDFFEHIIESMAGEEIFHRVLDIAKFDTDFPFRDESAMLLPNLSNTTSESSLSNKCQFEEENIRDSNSRLNEKNDLIPTLLDSKNFTNGIKEDPSNLSTDFLLTQQTNNCESENRHFERSNEDNENIQLSQDKNKENSRGIFTDSVPSGANESLNVQENNILDFTYSIGPIYENSSKMPSGTQTLNEELLPFRLSRTPFLMTNICSNDIIPINSGIITNRPSESGDINVSTAMLSDNVQVLNETSEITATIPSSSDLFKKRKSNQGMQYYIEQSLKDNCQILIGNDSAGIFSTGENSDSKTEKSYLLNYNIINKCTSNLQKSETSLKSSDSIVQVLNKPSAQCFESQNVEMIRNHNALQVNPNVLEVCELSKVMSPFNFSSNDVHIYNKNIFDSKLIPFDYVVKGTNCSFVNCKAKEASSQIIPYESKTILCASEIHSLNFKSSMKSDRPDNFSKCFKFCEVQSNKIFEKKMREFSFDVQKSGISVTNLGKERKFDGKIKSKIEDDPCALDELLDSEDDSQLSTSDMDDNSSEGMFEDDYSHNVSNIQRDDEVDILNSNILKEKILLTTNILSKADELTNVSGSKRSAEFVEPKKSISCDLFPDLPIILKFVNDDTSEVEEMLIYPKECLDDISKTFESSGLTRSEILEKLISKSKIYDGKTKLGIITNIRKARKSLQKKDNCLSAGESCSQSETKMANDTTKKAKIDTICRGDVSCMTSCPVPDSANSPDISKTKKNNLQHHQGITSHLNFNLSKTFSISSPHSNKLLNTLPTSTYPILYKEKVSTKFRSKIPTSSSRPLLHWKNKMDGDKLKKKNMQIQNSLLSQQSVGDKQKYCISEESSAKRLDITPISLNFVNRQETSSKCPKRIYSSTPFSSIKEKNNCSNCDKAGKNSMVFFHTTRKQDISIEIESLSYHLNNIVEPKEIEKCKRTRHYQRISNASILSLKKSDITHTDHSVNFQDPVGKIPKVMKKRISAEEIISSDFKMFFRFYAKVGGRLKSGLVITKANSNYWLKKTGVIFDNKSTKIAEECFSEVARKKLVLNIYDYIQYLTAIARRKKVSLSDLVQQLKSVEISVPVQNKKTACKNMTPGETFESSEHASVVVGNPQIIQKAKSDTFNRRSSRIPISSTTIKKFQAKS